MFGHVKNNAELCTRFSEERQSQSKKAEREQQTTLDKGLVNGS